MGVGCCVKPKRKLLSPGRSFRKQKTQFQFRLGNNWPWGSWVAFPSLSFLICKMQMEITQLPPRVSELRMVWCAEVLAHQCVPGPASRDPDSAGWVGPGVARFVFAKLRGGCEMPRGWEGQAEAGGALRRPSLSLSSTQSVLSGTSEKNG